MFNFLDVLCFIHFVTIFMSLDSSFRVLHFSVFMKLAVSIVGSFQFSGTCCSSFRVLTPIFMSCAIAIASVFHRLRSRLSAYIGPWSSFAVFLSSLLFFTWRVLSTSPSSFSAACWTFQFSSLDSRDFPWCCSPFHFPKLC